MSSSAEGPSQLPTSVDKTRHPSGIVPKIENIVSTAYLSTELVLDRIASKAKNAEYNPRRFSACIIRIRQPRTTALLFRSGKMVIMGAKSENDAHTAARQFTKIVEKTGTKVHLADFKIHNVVGCADVTFQIDLESLNIEHNDFCTYDPERFPGLIYRMAVPDVVLLVFHSGKVVLTKAKLREHVYKAFEELYPVLQKYKKQL